MAHVDNERKSRLINKINEAMQEMGVKLKFSSKVIDKRQSLKIEIYGCSENLIENYIKTAQTQLNEALELECSESEDISRTRIERAQNLSEYNPLFLKLDKLNEYFTGKSLDIIQGVKDALCSEFYVSSELHKTYDIAYGYYLEIGGSSKGFTTIKQK